MAMGTEIHFGFIGPTDIYKFLSRFQGATLVTLTRRPKPVTLQDVLSSKPRSRFDLDEAFGEKVNTLLQQAYEKSLDDMGWPYQKKKDSVDRPIYIIDTPWGKRNAYSWSMDLQYDPDECGDGIGDMSLGASLSARYYPHFLDLDDPNGGLPNSVSLDKRSQMIDIAKMRIIEAVPEFHDAVVYFRTIFY